jgi:hypothetical protein
LLPQTLGELTGALKRPFFILAPVRGARREEERMTETGVTPGTPVRRGRLFVRVAGFTFYLLAVQALLTAGVGLNVFFAGGSSSDLLLPAASALLAACYVAVGYFLRRYRVWARNFAFAFAAVSLFAFPIGTVLGALVVLCIDQANRANVFLPSAPRPAPALPVAAEEEAAIIQFEPELAADHVG